MRDTKFNVLEKTDFALIFMNEWQERTLRRYGHRMAAFDLIQETNSSDFVLHAYLVSDVDRQCTPVAFLVTNRTDGVILDVFFQCIRQRMGVVSPKTFMSDTQNMYYDNWIKVMGTVPKFHIFSPWHVQEAWRQNLRKIPNSARRQEIRNLVHHLHYELNPLSFEEKLQKFLQCQEDSAKEFLDYFQRNYSQNVQFWAHCHQQNLGVNTNMAAESFRRLFKRNAGKADTSTDQKFRHLRAVEKSGEFPTGGD